MARVDTLTAYKCKFRYMQRNNPLIEEQREEIKSGNEPTLTFEDFISLYSENSDKILIGKNSDRAIGLSKQRISSRTLNKTKSWYISPIAGKQGQPMTVVKRSTGKRYDFGSDAAALYNYHLFVYENENGIIAIFHRQNGSGCKSVFLETANNILKEKGIKLEMDLIVPLSDTTRDVTPTKITLQYIEENPSSDVADNLRKRKTIIRDVGLNLEVRDNSKVASIMHNDKSKSNNTADISSLMKSEPSDLEGATALYQKLMQKENEILSSNSQLWEKVFMSANKDSSKIEDGTNYGDFLLNTIENGKDNFTEDELKILKDGANQIKEIEGKLTILEQKYPGCGSKPREGESVDAESAGMVSNNSKLTKFPSFKGKDLDGNDVNSDDIFSSNKVTVINFWFTTCNPCVGELGDLEKLNKELAQKGGTVIGINSFTIGGDKTAISEAKDVLTKKGITYKNIWFDSNSEAGKFASGLYSYPTTYVVDKNGNIVGQPIVGAITSSSQAKQLNKLIDQAIENSKK